MAPSFALSDADGTIVTSSELLAKGPLVLTFYRGVWCPFCNIDLEETEGVAGDIRELGASLVAISPQNTASSRKTADTIHSSFPILSDRHGAVATAFGLRFRLPDDLIKIYRHFGVDLPAINGDESWTLPMPARYIVEQSGKITYAEVSPDYTRRSEPSDLLPALRQLHRAA
jgi:peroxiredoxin